MFSLNFRVRSKQNGGKLMALFDWGTYNGLTKLEKASLTGMRLTEIPPADFSRRWYTEDYFKQYNELASKYFVLITAHAPYYSLVNHDQYTHNKVKKAMVQAAKRARIAGAKIFNMHLGAKVRGVPYDYEPVVDVVKAILSEVPDIYVSLETTYTARFLGSLKEIKEIIEMVGDERVIPSAQLENDFMRELKVYEHGNIAAADKEATVDFWLNILNELKKMTNKFFSLRFSQIIAFRFRTFILKKRTPLGKGYPSLEPLAEALALFLTRDLYYAGANLEAHLIYTGPWQYKYKDTVKLYCTVMDRATAYIK
ncbi:xylose isomerase [Ignicoccus pacificus DSM 13166]|uniref:Xylose isomerase n=1 Tax=Ignicoccus pacificus DSM 13166 TaxID=940294 RepID=A0A977K993_9CREN|nr:xylose isomerase [Ignicoccus pacificus DSM 13166]